MASDIVLQAGEFRCLCTYRDTSKTPKGHRTVTVGSYISFNYDFHNNRIPVIGIVVQEEPTS